MDYNVELLKQCFEQLDGVNEDAYKKAMLALKHMNVDEAEDCNNNLGYIGECIAKDILKHSGYEENDVVLYQNQKEQNSNSNIKFANQKYRILFLKERNCIDQSVYDALNKIRYNRNKYGAHASESEEFINEKIKLEKAEESAECLKQILPWYTAEMKKPRQLKPVQWVRYLNDSGAFVGYGYKDDRYQRPIIIRSSIRPSDTKPESSIGQTAQDSQKRGKRKKSGNMQLISHYLTFIFALVSAVLFFLNRLKFMDFLQHGYSRTANQGFASDVLLPTLFIFLPWAISCVIFAFLIDWIWSRKTLRILFILAVIGTGIYFGVELIKPGFFNDAVIQVKQLFSGQGG